MKTRRKTRPIGNTEIMEISFPSYPKFNIYADTETFTLIPPNAQPWADPDTKTRNETLRTLTQVP